MTAYVRHYLRYVWKGQVCATTADDIQLQAQARNVSKEGLHLVFDQVSAQLIVPLGYVPNPTQPIELDLSIDEPGRKRLLLTAQVRGVRRLAQDAFSFHLEFVRLGTEVDQQLTDFIKSLPQES